jgi:hypothetical protein
MSINIIEKIKIKDNLTFYQEGIAVKLVRKIEVPAPTNHLIAIDCSYSMYSDLPKIRAQLKSKLPSLVKENDTITLIWFSGRGDCGVLCECERVTGLADLGNLNRLIDRYLQPQGLTAFVDPINEAGNVINRILGSTLQGSNEAFALFFLTDGYDNQYRENEIIKSLEAIKDKINSAVFVEYGYYCNSSLMTRMAETVGGMVAFSDGFKDYEPLLEQQFSKTIKASRKISVTLPIQPIGNVVVALDAERNVISYKVEDKVVTLPEDTYTFCYVGEDNVDVEPVMSTDSVANLPIHLVYYPVVVAMVQRMKTDVVYAMLDAVGDVSLLKQFASSFGKQALQAFQTRLGRVIRGEEPYYTEGFQTGLVPPDDAYCLLDLLEDLTNDEGARWYPTHPEFKYKSIGAKRVQNSDKMSDQEMDELKALLEQRDTLGFKKKMEEINSGKFTLKFNLVDDDKGYPLSDMVWNENRPNLSIRVYQKGVVELPANEHGMDSIDTFRYRTYTLIKDGIVNVEKLPVLVSQSLGNKLVENGIYKGDISVEFIDGKTYFRFTIDLTSIPLINRGMVREASAETLFKATYEVLMAKAMESAYNFFQKKYFPKESKGYSEVYGPEASAWLKQIGITDYNGFNPSTSEEKVGEVYMSRELTVKIDGMATMPTPKAVYDKIIAGKSLTPREEIMGMEMVAVRTLIGEANENGVLYPEAEQLIRTKLKGITRLKRDMMLRIAKAKFAVIISQGWFKEFETMDENRLSLEINGRALSFTVESTEKEIEL